jgi:hypothetical protein
MEHSIFFTFLFPVVTAQAALTAHKNEYKIILSDLRIHRIPYDVVGYFAVGN